MENLTEQAGHLVAWLLTVWFWTGASSLFFVGTERQRKCFQCYFYFIKINSKLLKDLFSRSELEMAIISHTCSTSCCAELPRALQDISRQAAPSISQTFTGCPACNNWRNCSRQPVRFTGSCGGTDVLVRLTKDRELQDCPWIHIGTLGLRRVPSENKQAPNFIYKSTVLDVILHLWRVCYASRRQRQGRERLSQTNPSPIPRWAAAAVRAHRCERSCVPRPREQKLKGTVEKQSDTLTWTGPMLLFLPPGMPSSLIAERKQTKPWWGTLLFSIPEIHKKVSTILKKIFVS